MTEYKNLSEKAKKALENFGIREKMIDAKLETPPSVITTQTNTRTTQDRIKRNVQIKAILPKLANNERNLAFYNYFYGHGTRAQLEELITFALRGLADKEVYLAKEKLRYKTKMNRKRTARDILIQYLPHHFVAKIMNEDIQPQLNRATKAELESLRNDIIKDRVPMYGEKDRVLSILENAITRKEIKPKAQPLKKKKHLPTAM